MAAWSRKTLNFFRNCCVFWINDFFGKIVKILFKSFHRGTDRHVLFKFREIWPTGNRWNRALLTWQKKIAWISSCRYCADRVPKICQGQPPAECSRFHPNRFTFGGVTAERVTSAKTRRKEWIQLIYLAEALASSDTSREIIVQQRAYTADKDDSDNEWQRNECMHFVNTECESEVTD